MLISFLFTIILIVLLNGTISSQRKKWVLVAFVFYFVVTLVDFYWLAYVLERPFHFTDPTDYYTRTLGIPLGTILKSDIDFSENFSNSFYFIINWCYNHFYDNPYTISFLIKINNILIILVSYLFLTKNNSIFSKNDLILLFNPYLLVTITRNIRDPYIILFVAMILGGLHVFENVKTRPWVLILGIALLSITREVLLVASLMVLFIRIIKRRRWLVYVLVPLTVGAIWFLRDLIFPRIVSQTISAMEFVHEDTSEFLPLLDQQFSLSSAILLMKRFGIGIVALLFTPHPINYYETWMANFGAHGTSGIYTGLDQVLIIIGAIYCYIYIIPRMFWYVHKRGSINNELFCFIVIFVTLYVVAFLGITDIRNRHCFLFYLMIGVICEESKCGHKIKIGGIYYLMSIAVFIGLLALSTH